MRYSPLAKIRNQSVAVFLGALLLGACSKSEPVASGDKEPTTEQHAARLGAWTEDYAAAVKQAKAEKKKILLDFTGSDWCINCWRLDDGVFSKPAFADFAQSHYVLVTLDFPVKKKLSEQLTDQNMGLLEKYKVQGSPTIILLDADENKLAFIEGYRGEDAAKFIDELEHPAAASPDKTATAPMPPAATAGK